MAVRKIRRNAATDNGIRVRLDDLTFEGVSDPRSKDSTKFKLSSVLTFLVMCLMSGARSQRLAELSSEALKDNFARSLFDGERIADNTIGAIVRIVSPFLLRDCLANGVLAEWHRKGLRPTRCPWSVVAIDGKHLATISERDLRRLVQDDPENPLPAEGLRVAVAARFPEVQLQVQDDGKQIVGLVRVHNATLVSSEAAVVIAQREIPGHTNEIGALPAFMTWLWQAFGRTNMMQVLTFDSGNTSFASTADIARRDRHFLATVKGSNGDVHAAAVKALGALGRDKASFVRIAREKGADVVHRIWVRDVLTDYCPWSHVAQMVRVERAVMTPAGEVMIGDRYFVTSLGPDDASPEDLLTIVRLHWRIENETHWTADAIWDEDARRTPWTKHPQGILVVGLLRAMAINIAAVLRALSRYREKPEDPNSPLVKHTWKHIVSAIRSLCFEPLIDTLEFDAAFNA